MATITEQIPQQGFELITMQLGAIMLIELDNQKTLSSSDYNIDVFLERIEPVDKSEDVVVNISINSINYDNHNEFDAHGSHVFNIDVYSFGVESPDETASDNVRIKVQKVLGWIRYILSSTKLKTLNFSPGFISGTYVQSINFDDTYYREDSSMTRMARLVFSVRAFEIQDPDETYDFEINDTSIKIDMTDKGYKLIFNT